MDYLESLNRRLPPGNFREAVEYVAAYLHRHPTTWYLQLPGDGRPCFLSESLGQLVRWLERPADEAVQNRSNSVRGEGWSL
ncbi:MAG: hypothetical protein KDA32_10705 [Phycisphaerales bacterium]|nr:hypothetical protein [Phycisphaerales bacterium]